MIINKIKNILTENIKEHKKSQLLLKEIYWANVFHDSIRGKKHIESLQLNIGRWAGSYSFFYLLNRILNDYQPKNIVEFGLGESTKFISTFIENELKDSKHTVIENNTNWAEAFKSRFHLSNSTSILNIELQEKNINGDIQREYVLPEKFEETDFDLFVVDGPNGSKKNSRTDILKFVRLFTNEKKFIILFDDTNRNGELQTVNEIIRRLKANKIKHYVASYSGDKTQHIISSAHYPYIQTF